MEQPKVVMYARFSADVEQEHIDAIKHEMDLFLDMIDAKLMAQKWEVLDTHEESPVIDYIIDECMRYGWSILTYDMNTLHPFKAGAISIIEDAAEDSVPIFFIDPESAMKSIFGI
jgi:hypothetical protein